MGKKSFADGRAMTIEEAETWTSLWDDLPGVNKRLAQGQKLLISSPGKAWNTVHANLGNISLNALVLKPVAELHRDKYKRLSAFPIDVYAVLIHDFYSKNAVSYQGREDIKDFDAKSWAWNQAWTMHKMFSKLRNKVQRDEKPHVPWHVGFNHIFRVHTGMWVPYKYT